VPHVASYMFSYCLAAAAFALTAAALWRRRGDADAGRFEKASYRTMLLAFPFMTFGLLSGALWAEEAWGVYWSWDPKETWSLITWIFYALALHLRRTRGWRDEKFAWLSILGITLVAFTYFGVNFLLSGLHSYARG